MIDKHYYEVGNINDHYGIKPDVIEFLMELEEFDKRLRKFLGPNKVKTAGVDARRSCRMMQKSLDEIKKKIQMTKLDYESDYEDD